ncbi:MAG: MarR family transcriptional regulator [Candidatus Marinimicrobia bacterium]|nr:MarR family transcriptional regulator [Candidatus Neomarinimicrobiota bacterium]
MSKHDILLLENQLCFPIYAASRVIIRHYQPYLDELNLTYPQYLVMMVLWEKSPLTVTEIGNRLFLNSNTLTPIIKKMIKKGFIEKTRDLDDERKVKITLTENGLALQDKAQQVPVSLLNNINIPNEDLLKMREIMWKFLTDMVRV